MWFKHSYCVKALKAKLGAAAKTEINHFINVKPMSKCRNKVPELKGASLA